MATNNQVSFLFLLSRLRKAVETSAIVASIIFLTGSQVFSEEAARSGQLSIVLENDVFFRTDQHYTNGVALACAGRNIRAGLDHQDCALDSLVS